MGGEEDELFTLTGEGAFQIVAFPSLHIPNVSFGSKIAFLHPAEV